MLFHVAKNFNGCKLNFAENVHVQTGFRVKKDVSNSATATLARVSVCMERVCEWDAV